MNKTLTTQPSKTRLLIAFFWIILAYTLVIAAGYLTLHFLSSYHLLIQLFWADFVGTVVVFGFSYVFKNSSFYDPYWSVIPILLVIFLGLQVPFGVDYARQVLVFLLVIAWGLRLTFNWARQWTGLEHEDWRYQDLQTKTGKSYWLVSFLGIHLFPTVLVFLACLPLYAVLLFSNTPFNYVDFIAAGITVLAIWMEAKADNQLRKFVLYNREKGKIMDTGLWAYSRHPNYLGEMLFWWGIFLFALALDLSYWWTGIGTLSITAMFVFITVDMMEERQKRKPAFKEYSQRVSKLIPWFPKKKIK